MSHRKEEEPAMFNVVLAKLLGFDRIINPESVKFGGRNVYRLFTGLLVMYVGLMSVITCFNGLYNWTDHRDEAILYFGIAEFSVFVCYKMSTLIHVTRLLDLWRKRIVLITFAYALGCLFSAVMYVLSPFMFSHRASTTKSLDGSQSDYQINVINLHAMCSAETYNAHFNMIYMIEASHICICVFFFVVFDTLFISLCLAFSCQLQVINIAFDSSGPKQFIKDSVQNKIDDEIGSSIVHSTFEQSLAYNELKSIIIEHQSIIEKLEHFFSIFQAVMLSQIIVLIFMIVAIFLNLVTKFPDGKIDDGSRATVIRMMLSCPVGVIQLFMTCSLFEYLQNQKESIVFALYSSNWTKMDMECRELILMTMRMNNAHKQKLKFSQLKITIRICYSILSMILKFISN